MIYNSFALCAGFLTLEYPEKTDTVMWIHHENGTIIIPKSEFLKCFGP